jgi:hypothetical protein
MNPREIHAWLLACPLWLKARLTPAEWIALNSVALDHLADQRPDNATLQEAREAICRAEALEAEHMLEKVAFMQRLTALLQAQICQADKWPTSFRFPMPETAAQKEGFQLWLDQWQQQTGKTLQIDFQGDRKTCERSERGL